MDLEPENVPFDVLHEDPDFLVIDKPSGLVVHPAPGNWTGTLVHGLLFRYGDFGELSGARRPGIVHRLDAGTSGLMVIARNQWAHERLSLAFKKRFVDKEYLALVWKIVPWEVLEVRFPIGRDPHNRVRMSVHPDGKEAHTTFRVLRRFRKATLLACRLYTGRTHQIRVHASAIGHPLVGDTLYGPEYPLFPEVERIFLHAWKLRFPHPRTWEKIGFRSCLPQELVAMLQVFDATTRG
jgi:23S rRNA pseudouridine1911/1915/1917 synthase